MEEGIELFDRHMGLHLLTVPREGKSVAQVLVSQDCSYKKGRKKKSEIVLMQQYAKRSSGHVSARLQESGPVIINVLTEREANV